MKSHLRFACLFATILSTTALAFSQSAKNADSAGAKRDLYGDVSPAEFAKREAVQQRIDPQSFDAALLSAAIFHRTNAVRAEHDLPALTFDPKAAAAAQKHSEAMASGDYLSHGTPNKKKNLSPHDRLQNEGLKPQFSAENIAFNFLRQYESGKPFFTREKDGETIYSYEPEGDPIERRTYAGFAQEIVQQWMDSPPHRKNMLAKEPTNLGVGAALSVAKSGFDQIYATQNFFAPFPAR